MGLLGATCFTFGCIMSNGNFQLQSIFLLSMSLLTLDGIMENKSSIVYILIGLVALSLFLISVMSQKIILHSLKDYLFILFPIAFIILGIVVHLGYLPEKVDASNFQKK